MKYYGKLCVVGCRSNYYGETTVAGFYFTTKHEDKIIEGIIAEIKTVNLLY